MRMCVCDLNLRPRINGAATFIEQGTSFDSSILDDQTLVELERQGHLVMEAEFVEVPKEEKKKRTKPRAAKAVEPPKAEALEAVPKGIWDFKKEEIEGLSVEALNAVYKGRADEYGISVTVIKDKDKLVEKLTSEA